MTWADWFSFSRSTLPENIGQRLSQWRELPDVDWNARFADARFVVLDTETTGLDVQHAELLSIGACIVERGEVRYNQAFEIDLKPKSLSSTQNVLIHEIGHQRQQVGLDPAEALTRFLEYAGKPAYVAHHALFDASMLGRAIKRHLHAKLEQHWLDIGLLLPALLGETNAGPVELDDLIVRFGASCPVRHNALADAFATAQLLLVALQQAHSLGRRTLADLLRIQRNALSRPTQNEARMPGA